MKRIILVVMAFVMAVSASYAQNFADKKGYLGNVELELGYITGTNAFDSAILTTHGYSTGNGWFFGAGTGLRITPNHHAIVSIPFYADVRYSFCNGYVRPFVDMKLGTEMNVEEVTAGLYLSPSIGVMINRYSISLKYGYSNGYTSYMSSNKLVGYQYDTHAISVGLAVSF